MKLVPTNVTLPDFVAARVHQLWRKRCETDGKLQLWKVMRDIILKGLEFFDPETGLIRKPQSPKPNFPRFESEADFDEHGDPAALIRAMDESPLMLWLSAPNNACLHANRKLTAYSGWSVKEFLHLGWADLIHPDDRSRAFQICREGFQTHRPFQFVYRLRRADGRFGWIYDQAEPRTLPNGVCAGYIGVMYELTTEAGAVRYESVIPPAIQPPVEGKDVQFENLIIRAFTPSRRPKRHGYDLAIFEAKHHSKE